MYDQEKNFLPEIMVYFSLVKKEKNNLGRCILRFHTTSFLGEMYTSFSYYEFLYKTASLSLNLNHRR